MSTVAAQSERNGVDVAKLFATLDAVKAQPEAARFRFGVNNRWISGTHNRNEIAAFYGVGAEQQHDATFAIEADHPAVLVGGDAARPGLKFLYRRNSSFVDGVASDARFVAARVMMRRMTARALAAAEPDARDLGA